MANNLSSLFVRLNHTFTFRQILLKKTTSQYFLTMQIISGIAKKLSEHMGGGECMPLEENHTAVFTVTQFM